MENIKIGSRVLVSYGRWIREPATVTKVNSNSVKVAIDNSPFGEEVITFTSQKGKRVHIELI
jgi:hypothetical protein